MHNPIYDGRRSPAPERIALKAGPLDMIYEHGSLRYIRLGEHEIIRTIYAAVRDEQWRTVTAEIHDLSIEHGDDGFTVTFTSDHQLDDVHFVWRGQINGSADGTISFAFDGEALTTFKRNRIGFCVLHPLTLAGHEMTVTHTDSTQETVTLPRHISPDAPAQDIRTLTHTVIDGVRAAVTMEGDVFEMEDQRNWTDASFKTYGTPSALPKPVLVEAGTRIEQRITLRLEGDAPQVDRTPPPAVLTFDLSQHVPLPEIGLCVSSSDDAAMTQRQRDRLRLLNLAHLRVDVDAGANAESTLRDGVQQAQDLGVALEIALHLGDDAAGQLGRVRDVVTALKPRIARWLIYQAGEPTPSRGILESAREALVALGAPVGGGTTGYYINLNQNRPPADLLDAVSYAVSPQVHAFDHSTMIETLATQTLMVGSARRIVPDARVAVGPVTLKAEGQSAEDDRAAREEGRLPISVDPRQMSLFGAGWTWGSIMALAQGGADSVTYYETIGWRGVIERESGSPLPEQFESAAGGVYPMYHVFEVVGTFAGGSVSAAHASDSLRFGGAALVKDDRECVLLVNYTDAPLTLILNGLEGEFAVRYLDANTAEQATRAPEAFTHAMGQRLTAVNGATVTLPPFALLRLDALNL